jgi:hypothetical protein
MMDEGISQEEVHQQRRILRREQIDHKEAMRHHRDELGSNRELLMQYRDVTNEMFGRTTHVREAFNDAQNLTEIARATRIHASRVTYILCHLLA